MKEIYTCTYLLKSSCEIYLVPIFFIWKQKLLVMSKMLVLNVIMNWSITSINAFCFFNFQDERNILVIG